MKKQKHKEIIYNIFRCNKSDSKETLNDILKGTKSVLASKTGFQQYIHNYSLSTKKHRLKPQESLNILYLNQIQHS